MKFKKLNQVNGGASLAIGASLLEITRGVHVLGITAHAQCQKHHEVTCWLVKDLIPHPTPFTLLFPCMDISIILSIHTQLLSLHFIHIRQLPTEVVQWCLQKKNFSISMGRTDIIYKIICWYTMWGMLAKLGWYSAGGQKMMTLLQWLLVI